jgi:hypothetical protein
MDEITVFLRDDDLGRLSPPLRAVVDLLLEEQVPCNYQVVPAQLDPDSARYARATQEQNPRLFFLNQHGYRHEQEIAGSHRYSEFDGARSYAEQRSELGLGRRILEDRLAGSFDGRIFTPPCHKYDENTLIALRELGFTILSAGVRVDRASRLYYALGSRLERVSWLGKRVSYHGGLTPRTRLAEVSVCIDVDEDEDARGRKIEKGASALWAEFERCSARTPVVGVMLHHARYDRAEKLEALRSFVRRLKEHPRVRFRNIQEIANDSRAS